MIPCYSTQLITRIVKIDDKGDMKWCLKMGVGGCIMNTTDGWSFVLFFINQAVEHASYNDNGKSDE